jgi:asparagine synthase (glutamine-hydrolysing)
MCGIVGIVLGPNGSDPRRLAAVQAMAATLSHRGPDADGVWIDREAGVALGHRRLAIVDLSEAGAQPMRSHSGRFVMTFNGETYNFQDLRLLLEARGHRFRGNSDTEVMLAAFEAFGVASALRQCAGMFAIGLWDREQRVLHLIRDRLGKKPLYVALADGALLFASELKAILAYPEFRPKVDPKAVAAFLRRGWVPEQHCIWEGVFKLPPGTMLSVRADDLASGSEDLRKRAQPWWSLAEVAERGQRDPLALSDWDLERELDRLLRLTVRERMVADVPLGAFLSGGIDSSTVVALMQVQSPRPIRTFAIGFGERGYCEAQHAGEVARYLGTEHVEFRVTASEALTTIPELSSVWDEPFADESQIPTLMLARLARKSVTVALSGDGGDECFAGYSRHVVPSRLAPLFSLPQAPRRLAASALAVTRRARGSGSSFLRAIPVPAGLDSTLRGESLRKFVSILDAADDRDLYERLTASGAGSMALHADTAESDRLSFLADPIARLIYRDMAGYLPGDILVKLDRATMAASLEARCPFLDHRVVEFVWRLPTSCKIRKGRGKWPLRRLLSRYLPESLFERPKHGFNVPIGDWLVGPLRDWAEDLIDPARIRSECFLDAALVHRCWREHVSGRNDRSGELWPILMLQAWFESIRRPTAAPVLARNPARADASPYLQEAASGR